MARTGTRTASVRKTVQVCSISTSVGRQRASAATAFIRPIVDRPNFTLITEAEATRILFDGTRASGVEYVKDGQTHTVRADREIIVSGGAFLSPKLLMLSGIGPADTLRQHGLPVVQDLTGVGRNLQDHMQLPVVYRTKVGLPTRRCSRATYFCAHSSRQRRSPDRSAALHAERAGSMAPILPDFGGPVCIFCPSWCNRSASAKLRCARQSA